MTTPFDKHPDLDKETGSALDWFDSMAMGFGQNDAVFDLGDYRSRDLNDMLKKDYKSRQLEAILTLPHRRAVPYFEPPKSGDVGQTEWCSEFFLERGSEAGGMSTPLSLVIAQMTSARTHRRSYMEKVFTKDKDGRIVYDKLAWRPATTCRMKRDGKTGAFRGFEQDPPATKNISQSMEPVQIPTERAFVYINGTHRDPIAGVSDLDIAYWCYETKRKVMLLWFSFLEQTSLPRTLLMAPDQGKANEIARNMASMKASGILPIASAGEGANSVKAQVLDTSGKGADQFLAALKYLDSAASNSVLAGFSDLAGAAASGTGSFALSQHGGDFFLQQEEAVSQEMAASLTRHVVAPLIRYNYGPTAAIPNLRFKPLAEKDVETSVGLLQAVMTTPQAVPREFLAMLAELVAGHLEMDVEKVRSAFNSAEFKAQTKAAALGATMAGQQVAGVAGTVAEAQRQVSAKVQEATATTKLNPPAPPARPAAPPRPNPSR